MPPMDLSHESTLFKFFFVQLWGRTFKLNMELSGVFGSSAAFILLYTLQNKLPIFLFIDDSKFSKTK